MDNGRGGTDEELQVRSLHPVGKSTLRQGITVPIDAQAPWLQPTGEFSDVLVVTVPRRT